MLTPVNAGSPTLLEFAGQLLVMAETRGARFNREQVQAIEDMVDKGIADNQSEAHRMLVNAGMHEYGYTNGGYSETALKTVCGEMAKLFLVSGLILVGVTYFYPVQLRLLAVGPIVSGLFLMGVERVLESHEPKVTNALRGLIGGETA